MQIVLKQILTQKLNELKNQALSSLNRVKSEEELYGLKVRYLGKKGLLTDILKDLGKLNPEDRPVIGAQANRLKSELEESYRRQSEEIKSHQIASALEKEKIDVTLPGLYIPGGRLHPLNRVLSEMKQIFSSMGFDIFEGPEIETDYYNFEALNIPKNHPAREMQDTFYLGRRDQVEGKRGGKQQPEELLLRTHTSPVQIRVMEKEKPPIQMVAPGVVYRRDADISHSPMFHQIEGLMVDEGITLGHLKGVLEEFLHRIFKPDTKVKFRPSFFPFTEPSAEVDIQCVLCEGKAKLPGGEPCRVCKESGWVEIMGCGMVDPEVFKYVKIDSEKYTGFAFGIGIERVAMLKYGINDIRLFFENDKRFLEQF